jgi:hypothetical protein
MGSLTAARSGRTFGSGSGSDPRTRWPKSTTPDGLPHHHRTLPGWKSRWMNVGVYSGAASCHSRTALDMLGIPSILAASLPPALTPGAR